MAVTKLIPMATAFVALFMSGCAVDLSRSTPGSSQSSCAPTSDQIADFQTTENAILLNTTTISGTALRGCAFCHVSGSGNAGNSVFLLVGTANSGNVTTSTANFCTMQLKGKTRMAHPQDSSHAGGQYPQTSIPTYYSLLTKYF